VNETPWFKHEAMPSKKETRPEMSVNGSKLGLREELVWSPENGESRANGSKTH
jgi:hypothetical protein